MDDQVADFLEDVARTTVRWAAVGAGLWSGMMIGLGMAIMWGLS